MEALVRRRAGHRGRATGLMKKLSSELEKPNPSLDEVEMYSVELERQRDKIEDLDAQILEKTQDDETEIMESSEVIMNINLNLNKSKRFFKNLENESRHGATNPSINQSVKLPQLKLAKFSGSPLE